MKILSIITCLWVLGSFAPVATCDPGSSVITPRGGGLAIEREVLSVTEAGVLTVDGNQRVLIGLDRVKGISGAASGAFAQHAPLATELWRARVRLERADISGAEPIFERHAPTYAMMSGPTAALVHVGLMRCRIERGALSGALFPWLQAVAAGDAVDHAASVIRSESRDALLVDRETGLAPSLAPLFVDVPSTRALLKSAWPHESFRGDDRKDVERALELSAWYRAALCFELGERVDAPAAQGSSDRGLTLIREIVLARVADPARRAVARNSLKIRAQESQSAWIRVWTNVAIGRSLLLEADLEDQLLGVGLLLEVVAVEPGVLPELTAIAYAEAATTLDVLGERSDALKLWAELEAFAPDHPVLENRSSIRGSRAGSGAGQGSDR